MIRNDEIWLATEPMDMWAKPDPSLGTGSQELVVRGLVTQWSPCGHHHEPDPVTAKLNEYEPYAYLKDVLARLPTQKASAIHELLPHNWKPVDDGKRPVNTG